MMVEELKKFFKQQILTPSDLSHLSLTGQQRLIMWIIAVVLLSITMGAFIWLMVAFGEISRMPISDVGKVLLDLLLAALFLVGNKCLVLLANKTILRMPLKNKEAM